ncbi:hypothetical protein RDABS01_002872 [Bienertia sinuspersici]
MGIWWCDVEASLVSYSSNHVAIDVVNQDNQPIWRAVGIYGWPDSASKYKTWALMNNLESSCPIPCIMFRDFNEIVRSLEKEGDVPRRECQMDAFRNAINDCSLKDMGYKGSGFTWQRRNNPCTFVRERLDRFLADDQWCKLFPYYKVNHFPIYKSDHALICLNTNVVNVGDNINKYLMFEALWLSKEECWQVVKDAWNNSQSMQAHNGPRLLLALLRRGLKRTEKELKIWQNQRPDQAMLSKCSILSNELDKLRRLEESYWHARSRANELRDGDKNTNYFHHKASQRRRRNFIKGENGGHVLVPNRSQEMSLRVADLIDQSFGVWNVDIIKGLFNEEDYRKILAIPLPSYNGRDGQYWWPTKTGEYTVKSGYWMERLGKTSISSSGDMESDV